MTVGGFVPMARELATERLVLGMWQESDAAWYRELVGERGGDTPTLDAARSKITGLRNAAVENGNAASFRVLEKLGFERHHSTWGDNGEVVWSIRELDREHGSL